MVMNTNARTEWREGESSGVRSVTFSGTCGRDTLSDNGERLLSVSANYGLASLPEWSGG